jgi:superfamily I DNA and/or RNA helicase
MASHAEHFDRLRRLLDLETKAEAEDAAERARRLTPEDAEASGRSLIDLSMIDEAPHLAGRTVVELRKGAGRLPWTRLDVGTPVVLSWSPSFAAKQRTRRGVVSDKTESSLHVALDAGSEETPDEVLVRVDLAHDQTAADRQRAALNVAGSAKRDRLAELRSVLLGERAATFRPLDQPIAFLSRLDASQQEAVRFALGANDLALIHGPPGTGKTSTLVEIMRQAVRRGERVLACAPSNMAVDNMLLRLASAGERVIRLGHPARVLPELVEHTLDAAIDRHEDVRLARKLVREARALRRKADKFTRAKPLPGEKQRMRDEVRALFMDARKLEEQARERILDGASIVCSTTSIDDEILGRRRFDRVVIDEACQSTEPSSWVPVLRAERVVLAGDHRQLPPTILSREAEAQGFGVSLFERLASEMGVGILRRLDRQYRMHRAIMSFPSNEMYEGTLEADESVAGHLLAQLPGVATSALTDTPIEYIDTAGAGFGEEIEPDGESRRNPEEAELVVRKVSALIEAGVAEVAIAVIAPYAAQVRLIRERLIDRAGVEVDTVDGFQGREKEAIVISMVRSNDRQEIGFLAELRRTNVAFTRARRKLIVIGDSATLSAEPFYARWIDAVDVMDAHKTIWDDA